MSPTDFFSFNDIDFFIKRDDLIDPFINGNKARKFQFLLNWSKPIDEIISHGSLQSNALVALSYIAKQRNIPFIYHTNRNEDFIKQHKDEGNLKIALDNQTTIIPHDYDEYSQMCSNIFLQKGYCNTSKKFYIVEGGALSHAEEGMATLANEIFLWSKINNITDFSVFLPSGTGSSAFFLQKHLNTQGIIITVYKNNDLRQGEFQKFGTSYLTALVIETNHKTKYGHLDSTLLKTITDIEEASNISFDRVYDPKGFQSIFDNRDLFSNKPILYIHCGGLTSNCMF